jgi:hypothetical protein
MKPKNNAWVCIICSQTFTRNSSAKRHNTNLHEGKGVHVRYIEYEIGRIQGKYFQNDPVFYKKNLLPIMIFPVNKMEIIDYYHLSLFIIVGSGVIMTFPVLL